MAEPEDPGINHANIATAGRQFLLRARGPGGLGAKQCDALAALLETAETEARVLSKASEALGGAAGQAKEILLRCRAPDTDPGAYDERQRVIGLLEDLVRGLADTNGLRVLWLSQAAAEALKLPPPDGKPGVLKWRTEGRGRP